MKKCIFALALVAAPMLFSCRQESPKQIEEQEVQVLSSAKGQTIELNLQAETEDLRAFTYETTGTGLPQLSLTAGGKVKVLCAFCKLNDKKNIDL